MISTGVSGLDEMLGGGIPCGSRVLYSLEPGANGQLFMISALSHALAKRLTCLVILPHTTVDAFRNDVAAMYGTKLDLSLKTVIFVDAIDRERIQKGTGTKEAMEREWQARLQKICRDHKVEVIFAYFDLMSEDFGVENSIRVLESARLDVKSTLFIEHLNLEGAPLLNRFIKEFSFDLVMTARSSSRPPPPFNYYTLVHTNWLPLPVRSVPFIISAGRIIPYIPKIVVTGPAHSGKSTFVRNATEVYRSEDSTRPTGDPGTAAGMDFGWLRWKNFDIKLLGTPGQTQFDPLIPPAMKQAMGVVLVIDATRPDTLPRAKHLLEIVTKQKVPMVVAANKKDLPDLMNEVEIRKSLGISDNVPVCFISATEKTDVRSVLESLVDFITQFPY